MVILREREEPHYSIGNEVLASPSRDSSLSPWDPTSHAEIRLIPSILSYVCLAKRARPMFRSLVADSAVFCEWGSIVRFSLIIFVAVRPHHSLLAGSIESALLVCSRLSAAPRLAKAGEDLSLGPRRGRKPTFGQLAEHVVLSHKLHGLLRFTFSSFICICVEIHSFRLTIFVVHFEWCALENKARLSWVGLFCFCFAFSQNYENY